jgi:hypothetical protein
MTAIDDQVRSRGETTSLAQQEDDRTPIFVRGGKTVEHRAAQPFFFQIGTGGEETVCHGRTDVAGGQGLQ